MRLPDKPRIVASGPTDRRAGSPVFLGLHRCDLVGRTGFEPVTSSVSSGKSRAFFGVCHCPTEWNGEPLTCASILAASRRVRRRLIALAPISGSPWSAGPGSCGHRHLGHLAVTRGFCRPGAASLSPSSSVSRTGSCCRRDRRARPHADPIRCPMTLASLARLVAAEPDFDSQWRLVVEFLKEYHQEPPGDV